MSPTQERVRRAAAALVDHGLLGVCAVLLQPLLMILYLLGASGRDPTGAMHDAHDTVLFVALLSIQGLIALAYFTCFHACRWGATPGKRMFGLRVQARDGRRMTLPRSALRALASLPAVASAGLGYAFYLVDPQRRAVQDLLAGSRVVPATTQGPFADSARAALPPWAAALVVIAIAGSLLVAALPLSIAFGRMS